MWKMPSPPVVVNNTPLVGLFNLRRLDLLAGVYESVAIPKAVEAEFLAIDQADRAAALRASGVRTVGVRDSRLTLPHLTLQPAGSAGSMSVLAKSSPTKSRGQPRSLARS